MTVNCSDLRDTEHSEQLAVILWHGKKGFEFQHILPLDRSFAGLLQGGVSQLHPS